MTEGFQFIGIAIHTTNQNHQAQADIGQLWERFFKEGILDRIPNRINDEILSIYTDYKSNDAQEYTVLLGARVSTIKDIPQGMVARDFPGQNYQTYIAKGPMPDARCRYRYLATHLE